MYTSATIHNKLVIIIGDLTCEQIRNHVGQSKFYSVMANEVPDSANKEQLRLVLHYLNPETSKVREDLVEFSECDMGVTGKAVAESILCLLQKFNLDSTLLGGQAMMVLATWQGRPGKLHVDKYHRDWFKDIRKYSK